MLQYHAQCFTLFLQPPTLKTTWSKREKRYSDKKHCLSFPRKKKVRKRKRERERKSDVNEKERDIE